MVRATTALVIGFLVLLGWSTAAAAGDGPTTDQATPAVSKGQPKPLLGLDPEPITGLLTPLTESVGTTLETATKPVVTTLAPTVRATNETVRPVGQAVQEAAKPLAPVIAPVVQAVEPIVQPVVDHVVAPVVTPVVEHVVAPVLAPTLEPVTTSITEGLGESPSSSATEPVENALAPIIDPLAEAAAPVETSRPGTANDVDQPVDAADAANSAGSAAEVADRGPSIAGTAPVTADPSGLSASTPGATSIVTTGDPAPDGPTTSSDLPDVPSPALPDGAPCNTSSSSTGGPFVAATAPSVETHGRSWRRLSSCATTLAIPDGRPRPQPGFSPG